MNLALHMNRIAKEMEESPWMRHSTIIANELERCHRAEEAPASKATNPGLKTTLNPNKDSSPNPGLNLDPDSESRSDESYESDLSDWKMKGTTFKFC